MKYRRLGRCLFVLALLAGAVAAHGQSITSFSPAYGQPGQQVDIYISGFSAGVAQVQFGSVNADFQVINAGHVRATVPTNGLTGVIYLVGPPPTYRQASSSSFFYVAPRIDYFFKTGSTGVIATTNDVVQVEGANFGTVANTVVMIGAFVVPAAKVFIGASSQLQITVPAGATTGPIGIGNIAGTNFSQTNLVIGNGLVITGFAPPSGTTNTKVILDGGNFTGVTSVTFNGANAPNFSITAPNQLHVFVPPGATTGPIGVQKPGVNFVSGSNFVVTGMAPIVTGFTPAGGETNASVVIEGVNFTTATNVTFNGTPVTAFNVTADTQIHTTVPPGATAGPIRVFNPYGVGVSTNNFLLSPIIESFDPVLGQVGDSVNIFGVNLPGVTGVRFGGVPAVFSFLAQNQIRATVPSGVGSGPISVINPAGTNTTSSNFTVIASAPVITGFPSSGLVGGTIQITGANLFGVTNVLFNGVNAVSFGVTSDSQINDVVIPPTATTGPISVQGPGGTTTSTNNFFLPPRLTGMTPTIGIVGSTVTLDGSSFTGVSAVEFTAGGSLYLPASFTLTATQIVATVPTNAITGPLRMTAPAGVLITTNSFTVLHGGMAITGFSPPSGQPGQLIQITGTNFTGVTNVSFNGVSAVSFEVTDTQINDVIIPPAATTGPISVSGPRGTATTVSNFFLPPRLTRMTPDFGIVGSTVTLDGDSFTGVSAVEFVAVNSSYVSAAFTLGATQIMATVPTNAFTGPLRITAPSGVIFTTNSFFVRPKVHSISPLAGPAGTLVTISGNGFNTVTNVRFGTNNAVFTSTNSTVIRATVPSVGTLTGLVTVATTAGTNAITNLFVVTADADVSVKITSSPVIGLQGHPLTYSVVVSNAGPTLATSLAVSNVIPVNIQFISITSTVGFVTGEEGLILWFIPVLTNSTHATLTIVTKPTNTMALTFSSGVSAAEAELLPLDNSATLNTPVVSDEQRTISVLRLTDSTDIELRWPASAVTFRLQQGAPLSFVSSSWLDVSGVLQVTNTNGVFHVYTNGTIDEPQFFRLRYP